MTIIALAGRSWPVDVGKGCRAGIRHKEELVLDWLGVPANRAVDRIGQYNPDQCCDKV